MLLAELSVVLSSSPPQLIPVSARFYGKEGKVSNLSYLIFDVPSRSNVSSEP